jgi:CheY-like chemotaxis protein
MDKPGFIFVDDDRLIHMFCNMLVKKTMGEAEVKNFLQPEEGLKFLNSGLDGFSNNQPVLLFLDLNMPTMSGWEFLEYFHKLEAAIKDRITVYILSSSVDDRDKERASAIPYVIDYLTKPLTAAQLQQLCMEAGSGLRLAKVQQAGL